MTDEAAETGGRSRQEHAESTDGADGGRLQGEGAAVDLAVGGGPPLRPPGAGAGTGTGGA